jgi:histidine triad (HIT) family protein
MKDCIFCKIAKHEIPSKIVYEDEELICFHDNKPSAPTHVLIISKKHLEWQALKDADRTLLGKIFLVAPEIAKKLNVYDSGFKLVMNCGEGVGQRVAHFHIHLLAF